MTVLAHLHGDFRKIMRISHSGADVQAKVVAVLDRALPNANILHATLLERLAQQQWLQNWIQVLLHVFNQQRVSELQEHKIRKHYMRCLKIAFQPFGCHMQFSQKFAEL